MQCFRPFGSAVSRASTASAPGAAARITTPVTIASITAGKKRKADSTSDPVPADSERPVKSPRRSPPPPAGRSPKSKRAGILSRYRTSASPFGRVDPPTFGKNKNGHTIPFSIDAALAGTFKSHKPSKTKEYAADTVIGSMPKGWMFDIYTDSKEEEATNLMEHSTCQLDISDDENLFQKVIDDENKENIPPHPGMNAPVMSAVFMQYEKAKSKSLGIEVDRKPLGELDAAEHYAAGCDANAFFVVPEDEDVKSNTQNEIMPEAATQYTTAKLKIEAVDAEISWNDIVDMAKPTNGSTGLTPAMAVMRTGSASTLAPVLEEDPLLPVPVKPSTMDKDSVTVKMEDEDVAAGSAL